LPLAQKTETKNAIPGTQLTNPQPLRRLVGIVVIGGLAACNRAGLSTETARL
jgi:hypothetical protein